MSHRVLAVVEGQTEFSVLNSTVAPHLGALGVFLYPKVVGRPGHKGGVFRSFGSISKEIVNLFRQEPTAVVTTFFDFYAMPEDWPGVEAAERAKAQGLPTTRVAQIVEEAWQAEIAAQTAELALPARFIPYVQMHELETLLFASPKDMAEGFLQPRLEGEFAAIVADCGGCEEINDRPQYAPSKRIESLFSGYRKGRDRNKREDRRPHAPVIAARIGMPVIRAACPHFNDWVVSLEAIATPPPANA
jgi:Domain of unknown function (DUF4276)